MRRAISCRVAIMKMKSNKQVLDNLSALQSHVQGLGHLYIGVSNKCYVIYSLAGLLGICITSTTKQYPKQQLVCIFPMIPLTANEMSDQLDLDVDWSKGEGKQCKDQELTAAQVTAQESPPVCCRQSEEGLKEVVGGS